MPVKTTRQWLNPPSASNGVFSFVITSIESGRGDYEEHQLTIQDCRHYITLDFPAGKKYRTKTKAKLNRLYAALDLIAEALEDDD
jgi:hypothetical protein